MIFNRLWNPIIFISFVFNLLLIKSVIKFKQVLCSIREKSDLKSQVIISELDGQCKFFNFCIRFWESIIKDSQVLTFGLNKNSISKHNLEIMFPL